MIRSWVRQRHLIPTIPKHVYALGYARTDRVARLWDALLYAGPGSALTGACAAYQLGLLFYEPREITVQTPWKRRARSEFTLIRRRSVAWELHEGIPYATVPHLLLELAREGNVPILRRSLEVLDYQRRLDVGAAHHACGKGHQGSGRLRQALTHRLPQLARTKSPLEVDFLIVLDAHHLPLPRVNQPLHGAEPDMYWPELNLVVELDGDANHGTAAQKRRDQRRDAQLRSHGLTVIRLTHDDVHHALSATLMTLAAHGLRAENLRL